jgi:hypothetical protein
MATRKKKLDPIALAGILAVVSVTGFLAWKFLIKPAIDKKKGLVNPPGTNDVDYVEVVTDNIA